MLQSTHYELKLVEGSDIVNPLVIDRPNYEEIDGVMYENESKSIGSATELKSGTIHALTRSKGNQRFFCFTATSNYEAGDTFTVDSVPVTALLPNGTSLPDMAYVINGTVLCSLIGTLLTVYTVGAGLADDSLRLGGQLPEYYATASALTSVSNTANSAQTMAVNNSNAINEINSNLADLSNYSTSETAIGTWINGKTIYRKVVDLGALPNATNKTVSHGVTGITAFTRIYGIAWHTTRLFYVPLPYVSTSNVNNGIDLNIDFGVVYVNTGADYSSYMGYAIMEYTK